MPPFAPLSSTAVGMNVELVLLGPILPGKPFPSGKNGKRVATRIRKRKKRCINT